MSSSPVVVVVFLLVLVLVLVLPFSLFSCFSFLSFVFPIVSFLVFLEKMCFFFFSLYICAASGICIGVLQKMFRPLLVLRGDAVS